ncbi:MAG: response regulator transcription factor [Bacteroidota bacterium]
MSKKIAIVDDHKIVRDGLKLYLENDSNYVIIGEADNGRSALQLMNDNQVDLVLMDINMDGMDGIETTKQLIKAYPSLKIIALTMHNDYQHIKAMMDAGASGYLLKNCDEGELKSAINSVLNDDIYYSKEVAQTVMNNLAKKKSKSRSDELATPLTPRETEVYRLILDEMSNQEIADKLFISVRTVEVHKRNLLEKTGAKNTTGLVLYAVKNDLFSNI